MRGAHFQPLDPDIGPVPVPPFPDDLKMFFCIGAQKAGTSWLHSYLSAAPEVHFSPNKELHYFDVCANHGGMALRVRINALRVLADKMETGDTRLHAGMVERACDAAELLRIYTGKGGAEANRHDPYIKYLTRGRGAQRLVGDITPSYAVLNRENFADMASIGEARFIFILRDPVARLWSHFRMSATSDIGTGASAEQLMSTCRKRIATLHEANRLTRIERSDYLRTMAELEAVIPAERILYVFFEDLFDGEATQQVCDFLGIAHLPANSAERVNEGVSLPIPKDIETLFRLILDAQYSGIRARFGPRVPTRWRL